MRKLMCCLILLITLVSSLPAGAQEAPVLPDPGPFVKGTGELLQEGALVNGIPCDVYGYAFNRGDMSFSFVLMAYEWKVTGMDFTWEELGEEELADSSISKWYAISGNGLTAYLNLTGKLLGKACTIVLYIPQGMDFTLDGTQTDATPFYNDTFTGSSDGTSSFYNDAFIGSGGTTPFYNGSLYGGASGGTTSFLNDVFEGFDAPWPGGSSSDDPTACSFCYGSGTCPECYGSGRFRNPYTGSYLDCSCDHGDCPICDGEGVW